MLPIEISHDYEQLPLEARQQVIDFIEFLKSKYPRSSELDITEKPSKKFSAFGSIHVTRSVSLEEMDEAIAEGASRL